MASSGTDTKEESKTKCKNWGKCYRKDKTDLAQFLHPGNKSDDTEEEEKMPSKPSLQKTQDISSNSLENARLGSVAPPPAKEKVEGAPAQRIDVSLLLANTYVKGDINPTGWWMSEKLDGVRAYWNGSCFYSRNGNAFIAPKWFTKDLPPDMYLDGELFGGRKQFQSTVSIVKTPDHEDWNTIKFHVFDIPSMEKEPFEKRMEAIQKYFDKAKPQYAVFVEQSQCKGPKHLEEELEKVLDKGGEGLMIRQPKSQYEKTRSHTLLKIKKFYDAEAKVIGYKPGKGKLVGCTGALKCVMECEKEFNVGSGLTQEDRRNPPKIGSIITYKFQELTNSGIPRFPIYVGIRYDMDEPKDAEVITSASDD